MVSVFSDSKPIALMTTLVRAMLPSSSSLGISGGGGPASFDLDEPLESFQSASSFSFQAGAAGITIGEAESAVLLQVPGRMSKKMKS